MKIHTALLHVAPTGKSEAVSNNHRAFVNVYIRSNSYDDYFEKLVLILKDYNLIIINLEDFVEVNISAIHLIENDSLKNILSQLIDENYRFDYGFTTFESYPVE